MRVLQLIDSLEAGGAERVAVNLANALIPYIEKSYLCASRKEGLLKETLSIKAGYFFLEKQSSMDKRAIKKLNSFVKAENISIIHAHSSSFFLATLIKLYNKKVKIVWHDHYGNRANSSLISKLVLKRCSKTFNYIFCVNKNLESWAKNYLKFSEASYLANFVSENKSKAKTKLFGVDNKRLVCLANLRPDKDHFTLIEAFKMIENSHLDLTLHCIGKDFNDDYSRKIKEKVSKLQLNQKVFFYGSISDVLNALNQCDIAILSSKSEGLPMALLEYGLAGLPVVTTNVGECATVVTDKVNGLVVQPKNPEELSKAIDIYLKNGNLREKYSATYINHVRENYSEEVAINKIIKVYNKIL